MGHSIMTFSLNERRIGEFPYQGSQIPTDVPFDALTNNNNGSTGTQGFTQSETTVIAFGNTVVVGYTTQAQILAELTNSPVGLVPPTAVRLSPI